MPDLETMFSELDALKPSDELDRRIAGLESTSRRPRRPQVRNVRRVLSWGLAATCAVALVGALAFAAHSRREGPSTPPAASSPSPAQPPISGAFPARDGWFTESRHFSDEAGNEYMNSLASTIPYQDGSSDLSLGNTLADLPPDGIAIWIELVHSPPSGNDNSQPNLRLPLDLSQAACCGSPSGGPDRPLYQLGGNHGNYYAAVWTYFGSAKPTTAMFTRAQQMLNTFPFPAEFPADMPSTASVGTASGVSIQYPASWYGRLQSDMVYLGQSILLTSYPLGPNDSYIHARDNRPSGGVLILVMDVLPAGDYLHDSMLVPRPAEVKLGSPGGYEGLGNGYRVAFTDSGHAVIVYAAAEPSDEAMIDTILNSITVLPADATRE